MRWADWVFDPLHKLSRQNRIYGYAYLTAFFGRLLLWYLLEKEDR